MERYRDFTIDQCIDRIAELEDELAEQEAIIERLHYIQTQDAGTEAALLQRAEQFEAALAEADDDRLKAWAEVKEAWAKARQAEAERNKAIDELFATNINLEGARDELAQSERMLAWVYINYGEVLPGYEDAGDLKNWLADLRSRAEDGSE
jgi:chromosome segregation ATPase